MFVQVTNADGVAAWIFDPDRVADHDPPHDAPLLREDAANPLADMNELDIARAIRYGTLLSPQRYANLMLFALRITGTGASYRPEFQEHVWRPPELYLTSEFLERCQGLPVIWQHPPGDELTSEEFENRVIGTIMLPYLYDDEVWGIAKIYDESAAAMMSDKQLSTSPAVVFADPDVNETRKLDGDRHLLIEGKPSLVDHLAVCDAGVWDKGGPPTGVAAGAPEAAEGPSEVRPDILPLARLDAVIASLSEIIAQIGTARPNPRAE